jgi:hypothetical protein
MVLIGFVLIAAVTLVGCGRAEGARCGDGHRDPGEQCDDGAKNSDTAPGACRTTCKLPVCGDGVVDPGEQCDDGASNSATRPGACRANCKLPTCGDGVVDPGEQCDDGVKNSDTAPGACRTTCKLPTCGDGVVDPGEQCDNGPANSDTTPGACRTICMLPRCGDGVVDPGEQCDQGPANSDTTPGACRTNCVAAFCGDDVVDPGETCDDGVNDGSPGHCSPTCSCAAPQFVWADDLSGPETGEDVQLITYLAGNKDRLVYPPGISYSGNMAAVTRSLVLQQIDSHPSVRWGPLAWETVDAIVQTPGGHTLTENWTLAWAHQMGASDWWNVGALAPPLRITLDRAALFVYDVPPTNSEPPAFPADLLDKAVAALAANSLPLLIPMLSTSLQAAVTQAEAEASQGSRTPDVTNTNAVKVSTVVEGSTAYSVVQVSWTTMMGIPYAENWILAWYYDDDEGRWAMSGIASAYPRQRLGEVTRWWDLNRNSNNFERFGLYGREALARVLARNEAVEGLTTSAAEPTTQSLATAFLDDALRRYSLLALPDDPMLATNILAGHLAANYREGVWKFIETPYETFPMLAQAHEGWCEANIVLMSMLRWTGVKSRYVHDDSRITKVEVWTRHGFQVGTFDTGDRTVAQNQNWYWLGSSLADLSMDGIHTNPNIVVYYCDPYSYCAMRRLYMDSMTSTLFQKPSGLACFDWTTYPFNSVNFSWAQ